MPDLLYMRSYILVSELGSLAAAAKKLGISAAAISKQITKLESDLGVQLLRRTTRSLELTEIGKSYLEQCKRIFEEVDAASNLISQSKATPHGALKVVSGRHFAASYIVPHLKQFLKKFPEIELNLELAERMPDLEQESIDLLIGMSLSANNNVIQKKIATTRYCFCAAPDYLKKHGTPHKPRDLVHHRYITHSMRKPTDEIQFKKEVVKVHPYLLVNDVETLLQLAKEGLGIVMVHYYAACEMIVNGLLVEVLDEYLDQSIPIYVAYPERRFLSAKVRCFIDFFQRKI